MPITPQKFIDALTKTIENTAFQLQTKGDENGKIHPLAASKLLALAETLKKLPEKLSTVANTNEATYKKEIHRVMAEAYIDAYRIGRKQVAGKLGTSTTAKDILTISLENIIQQALDVAKPDGATIADNFLLPANFNPKEKFEKQFLKNITDQAVVKSTFDSTLVSIRLALEEGVRSKQLEIATNGMKVAVRFSPEAIKEWNNLVSQVGAGSELGISFGKNGQPKEASENNIKKILNTMVPKNVKSGALDTESLLKITKIITYLETMVAEVRLANKPLSTPTSRTPEQSTSERNMYSDEIKTPVTPSSPTSRRSSVSDSVPRRASVNDSAIPDAPPPSPPSPPQAPSPTSFTPSRTEKAEKPGFSSPDFSAELAKTRTAFFNQKKEDKKERPTPVTTKQQSKPDSLADLVKETMKGREKYFQVQEKEDTSDDEWDDDPKPKPSTPKR